jgi:DNA-binding transcriptional LysR family regulator
MKERPCRRRNLCGDSHSICATIFNCRWETVQHTDRDSKLKNAPRRSLTSAVDLVHLRYAVAAADHGSFRRAAETLLVQQSTLSRCIHQLEHSVGMVVFERSSRGVQATPAGRDLLRMARSILEQMDTLVTTSRSAGRGEAGRLAIGFYTSLSAGNLRATLIEYTQRFPRIVIGMIESSRIRLVTALRNGAIDLAIVTGEAPLLDNRSLSLWSERVLITLPEGHRLAASETIYWTDLKGETLLLSRRDPGPEIQDLLFAKLGSPDDRPKLLSYDVSRESIRSLVGAGFGIGLTIEASLGADFAGVTYREARDGTGPSRIGYSAHWRADNDNPALASFLKLLGERYRSPAD